MEAGEAAQKQGEELNRLKFRGKIAYISGPSSICTKTILASNSFRLKFREQPRQFQLGWGNPKSSRFYRKMPISAIYFQVPGSGIFGRKDSLARLLRGQSVHPETCVLPEEAQEARALVARHLCLYKPAQNARGNGIRLLRKGERFNTQNAAVVQRYCKSLLIDGYKFDLRLYVLVTCVDPLCVYLYREGLARFATVRHVRLLESAAERRMFLTNYAVNRAQTRRPASTAGTTGVSVARGLDQTVNGRPCGEQEAENADFKWTLTRLFDYLDKNSDLPRTTGKSPSELIFEQISEIVTQVFLAAEDHLIEQGLVAGTARAIPRRAAALYGADFIILESGKVQILEVNVCPSSGTATQIDRDIKYPMHNTMFEMTGAFEERCPTMKEELSQTQSKDIDLSAINPYERAVLNQIDKERTECGMFERMKLRNFLIALAYDGRNYHGSEVENEGGLPTIESQLFEAIEQAGLGPTPPKSFRRVSRTDTGVSAACAIFSAWFKCDIESIKAIELPEDIKLLSVERVFPTFDPLRFCTNRTYFYFIPRSAVDDIDFSAALNPPPEAPDLARQLAACESTEDRLIALCEEFVGVHDLCNFTSPNEQHTKRRIVSFTCTIEEGFYKLTIDGDGFLKHMIRRIVAVVLLCATAQLSSSQLLWLMQERRDEVMVPKAPAEFLVLYREEFRGFEGHAHYLELECCTQEVIDEGMKFLNRVWARSEWKEVVWDEIGFSWQGS